MLNHVMVGSNDLERSKRFYDAVLGLLGAGEPIRNTGPTGHTRLFYRHDGSLFGVTEPINGEPATVDWGDGAPVTTTVGALRQGIEHRYVDDDPTATVSDTMS